MFDILYRSYWNRQQPKPPANDYKLPANDYKLRANEHKLPQTTTTTHQTKDLTFCFFFQRTPLFWKTYSSVFNININKNFFFMT